MKRILAIALAAVMVFALAACGSKGGNDNAISHWESYESLDKLNDHFVSCLAHPPIAGVTEEHYQGLEYNGESIAEYSFKAGGFDYTFRFSPLFDKDISGVYVGKGTIFQNVEGDANVTTSDCKAAKWVTVDGQYCLVVKDGGKMDAKTFADIVEELRPLCIRGNAAEDNQSIYDNLAGEYNDSFSNRATLDVEAIEGGAKGLVSWGSSASESDTWEFTLKIGQGDRFEYSDCLHIRHTWDAQGKESVEEIAKNQSGYFTLNQKGDLLWDGAAEADCKDCVFEK